jgi:hypothetical protein
MELPERRCTGWNPEGGSNREIFLHPGRKTVPAKRLLVAGSSAVAGLLLLLALTVGGAALNRGRSGAALKPWNDKALRAKYVGSQLKELDRPFATLTLTYELENMTDVEYHLAEGSGLVIVRKLTTGEVLSQEEPIQLSYPAFLPARQSAAITIEITQPFAWPAEEDPAYDDKLRDFEKERLARIGEFVLVDEANRCQLELPGASEAN